MTALGGSTEDCELAVVSVGGLGKEVEIERQVAVAELTKKKKSFRSDLARRGQEGGNNTLFLSCCSPSLSLPSSLICT